MRRYTVWRLLHGVYHTWQNCFPRQGATLNECVHRRCRATKLMELQAELHAMGHELARQKKINAVVTERMQAAEAAAEAATAQADMAVKLANQYANIGGKQLFKRWSHSLHVLL